MHVFLIFVATNRQHTHFIVNSIFLNICRTVVNYDFSCENFSLLPLRIPSFYFCVFFYYISSFTSDLYFFFALLIFFSIYIVGVRHRHTQKRQYFNDFVEFLQIFFIWFFYSFRLNYSPKIRNLLILRNISPNYSIRSFWWDVYFLFFGFSIKCHKWTKSPLSIHKRVHKFKKSAKQRFLVDVKFIFFLLLGRFIGDVGGGSGLVLINTDQFGI